MGDKDRIKWDKTEKRFLPIRPGVKLCSYRAHIGRVTKKGVAPHYIIDGDSNFRHNSHCQLRNCQRTTTVRRRILSKLKVVDILHKLEYTNSFLSFGAISTPRVKTDFRLNAVQTECCSD